MSIVMIIIGFIVGIILLLILVTFHEFAHFVVAKLAGAYVYEFSIGFGPKIFSWGKKETKYTIRVFPLGGYVYIASEISDPPKGRENEPVLSSQKMENIARWKRVLFILSGAVMNFFIAVLIFTMAFSLSGQKPNDMTYWGATYPHEGVAYQSLKNSEGFSPSNPVLDYDKAVILGYWIFPPDFTEINMDTEISNFTSSSSPDTYTPPSSPDDSQVIFKRLINITPEGTKWNLKNYYNYYDTVNSFLTNLKKSYNDNKNNLPQVCLFYTILNKYQQQPQGLPKSNFSFYGNPNNITSPVYISKPTKVKLNGSTYTIGIAPPTRIFTSFAQGYAAGWKESGTESVTILKSFGMLFTGQWANLTGPVGIAKTMSGIFTQGALSLFLYVAMLSANLFVLNLLPIPPLDGYKFFETIIEGGVYFSQLWWWKILILCSPNNKEKYQARIHKLDKNWHLPHKWKIVVNIIGALIFLLLFVGITIKDIFF